MDRLLFIDRKRLQLAERILGAFLFSLGTAVLLGWIKKNTTLIQLNTNFTPMKANTAFGLALIGLSLLLPNGGCKPHPLKSYSAWLPFIVFLFGFSNLLEHLFGLDLGVDQLLIRDFISFHTAHPGRMTVNASLCLSLSALSLLALCCGRRAWLLYSTGIISAIIAVLSTLSLFSYALGVDPSYGLGAVLKMGFHTSVSFFLLSGLLFADAWMKYGETSPNYKRHWMPVVATTITLMLGTGLWISNLESGKERTRALIREDMYAMADSIKGVTVTSVEQVQSFVMTYSVMDKARERALLAEHLFKRLPEIQEILCLNPSFSVIHSYRRDESLRLASGNTEELVRVKSSLSLPPIERNIKIIRNLKLNNGDTGFVVVGTPRENPYCRFITLLGNSYIHFMKAVLSKGYLVEVWNAEGRAFSLTNTDSRLLKTWTEEYSFTFGPNVPLRIRLTPSEQKLRSYAFGSNAYFLISSLVFALVIGMLVFFLERSVETEEKFRKANSMLEDALANSEAGSWERDLESGSVYLDENIYSFLGFKSSEFTDHAAFGESQIHKDDLAAIRSALEDCISGKTPAFESVHRMRHKNGEWLWVDSRAKPTRWSKNGKVTKLSGMLFNISQQKKMEAELEQQRAMLANASKFAALGEMAGSIAHEINNPLSIIGAKAATVLEKNRRGTLSPMDIEKNMDIIESTIQRIAKTINSMRNFARTQDQDPFVSVSLKKVVGHTLDISAERLQTNGVLLVTALPEHEPYILGREAELIQVLINLLNNAKYAVQSGKEQWIRLELREAGDFAEFRVLDSGPGIPPEQRENLMKPFFTTKPPGKGTGLGLSISRKIAEAHGGELFLETQEAHTCFTLRLPKAHKPA